MTYMPHRRHGLESSRSPLHPANEGNISGSFIKANCPVNITTASAGAGHDPLLAEILWLGVALNVIASYTLWVVQLSRCEETWVGFMRRGPQMVRLKTA